MTSTEAIAKYALARLKGECGLAAFISCMLVPTQQKFAIYCAESCLHVFEAAYPLDKRPRYTIEAAKRCLDGPLKSAADAAGDTAARAAAWAAAWAAGDTAARAARAAVRAGVSEETLINYGLKLLEEQC